MHRRISPPSVLTGFEGLESRYLLAASITDRVLTVTGTGGNDVISLTRSGTDNVVDLDNLDSAVLLGWRIG